MDSSIWNVNFHEFNCKIIQFLLKERFEICDFTLINDRSYHRIIMKLKLWNYEILISNVGVIFVLDKKVCVPYQTFSKNNYSWFLESYNKIIEYFEELNDI